MSEKKQPIVTAWVKAGMKPLYKKSIDKKQIGTETVTKTKGLFKKTSYDTEVPIYERKEEWIPTGEHSDTEIDIDSFSNEIDRVCTEIINSGYEIMQIIPVNSGRYDWKYKEVGSTKRIIKETEKITGGGYGYGYGYGITDTVIIVGKLRNA